MKRISHLLFFLLGYLIFPVFNSFGNDDLTSSAYTKSEYRKFNMQDFFQSLIRNNPELSKQLESCGTDFQKRNDILLKVAYEAANLSYDPGDFSMGVSSCLSDTSDTTDNTDVSFDNKNNSFPLVTNAEKICKMTKEEMSLNFSNMDANTITSYLQNNAQTKFCENEGETMRTRLRAFTDDEITQLLVQIYPLKKADEKNRINRVIKFIFSDKSNNGKARDFKMLMTTLTNAEQTLTELRSNGNIFKAFSWLQDKIQDNLGLESKGLENLMAGLSEMLAAKHAPTSEQNSEKQQEYINFLDQLITIYTMEIGTISAQIANGKNSEKVYKEHLALKAIIKLHRNFKAYSHDLYNKLLIDDYASQMKESVAQNLERKKKMQDEAREKKEKKER
ncbi:MAG: hypothetical protein HQK50_12825 [Oligoflexia bacterium]|nr:hypothetical protein [Oligoflexia bacterium]